MNRLIPLCTGLLAFAIAGTATAHAGSAQHDQQADKVLAAMNDASTWGHPDLFGEFSGMQRYSRQDYAGALKYFRYGARYADKLSQLGIGLMYENGEGVAKDPVTACAWLALAAERKYPGFITTRDRVCEALTPAQHDQAVAVLDKLMPEYGDPVAKPRMAKALRQAMTEGTGSRLGFDSGVSQTAARQSCGGPTIYEGGVAVPKAGCGSTDFYDPSRWDPKKYFAARDAQWRGTVTVGNMQDVNKAAQATGAKGAAPAPTASVGSSTHQ
ncbi:MAG: sel1 repeat family protein [Rhodanobacteraceae bacterium]